MEEGGWKIRNQGECHFLTLTIVEWVDVFTRKDYRDILLDSIRYCQLKKGLWLHCWCLMSNHIHMMASAKEHNLSAVICDFKKYTSKALIKAIASNSSESRKDWMLRVFAEQGSGNIRNKEYQFWRQDNHPEELYSPKFIVQKMDYIHNNPVVAGIVANSWEYLYSSARDYHEQRKCGLLNVRFI